MTTGAKSNERSVWPLLVSELVGTALLLVSDASTFISGQTILVDGGFTAGSRWNVVPGTGYETYLEKYAPKD